MSATALNPQVEAAPSVGNSRRLLSLDALRGLTIAFMIMVNNNGSSDAWGFMKHADWNGMTPTDLVFPTFVFVVGASVVFAFEARLARGATRVELAWQTVRRAAILFGLGIVVNGFPYFPLGTLRIYGVLQRIAVCYLVAALFYLWDRRWQSKAVVVAAALIGYWIVMRWVPVPGLGLPGRDIPFLDKDANMVAFVDRHILPGRLYEGTRDPEGLLSDLPAVGTVLLGMLAGIWLRSIHSLRMKAVGLAGGAATLLALGSLWSLTFPLNKKLWTSSYVLVAAGISMAVLALFFWAIEVSGWRGKWTWPWLVLGSNAIFAYMLSELITGAIDALAGLMGVTHFSVSRWVFLHGFAWIPDQGLASFAYSFVFLLVCFVPTWVLYRNKIFLKV
jgi:predicted acyltransferase